MKFPLKTATKEYLAKRAERVGERTLDNEKRILNKLVQEIEAGKVNKLTTTNPYKIKVGDLKAILDFIKGKNLENETTIKYLQFFDGVLVHCGNHAMKELKEQSPHLFPKRTKKSISYLTEEELQSVRNAAKEIKGWKGSVLRFLTAIYPGTGLRPSELRLAQIDDLDTKKWSMKVRHPKGEGTFGARRVVVIVPPFRDGILQYLQERKDYLKSKGRDSKYLVPASYDDEDKPYSSNHFRKIKKDLEERTGIDFRLKDFRSTFASLTMKRNPNALPDVSKQLGHSSLVVTQTYYAAIEESDSSQRLVESWERIPTKIHEYPGQINQKELDMKPEKNVLIKPKEYMTGYC